MSGSALESLASRGASLAEKFAPGAGASVEGWAGKLADVLDARGIPSSPIRSAAPTLNKDTVDGFAAVASYVALGQEDDARLAWLAAGAEIDEILSAIDEADSARATDSAAREAAWQETKATAIQFLKDAGAVALPILLTMARGAL